MKGDKKCVSVILVAMTASLWTASLWAQQEGDEKPKPAARVMLPIPDLNGDQQDAQQDAQAMQPDLAPVGGVENLSLGRTEIRHSYWVPGIQFSNSTASPGGSGSAGWNTTNYVNGTFNLLEARNHAQLSVDYSGGGFFSNQPQGSGQYHQMASALEIDQQRWQALFVDQFSYLPQSAFGFGGTTGLASPGIAGSLSVPLPGLQNVFVPSQTVLAAGGPRYSNAGAVQLTYAVSRRGSLTVAAVHGLLRFIDAVNINSDTETFNAAYNYAITRKDTLGMVYRFSVYHFPGLPQALGDHAPQFVYGRKITGRLALSLGGGPEITTFRVPVGGSKRKLAGSGTASLIYAFPQSSLRVTYSHGVSAGSGFFTGANTDQINGYWTRPLTRAWNATASIGYARNRAIAGISGLASPNYNTWVPTVGLTRPLGPQASFSFGYQAQILSSNVAGCTTCAKSFTSHLLLVSVEWHSAPHVLR